MKLSAIDDYSAYLYHQGTNDSSYRLFGAHFTALPGAGLRALCRVGTSCTGCQCCR